MSEVPARFQDPETIRSILHTAKTVAIVGLSGKVLRPSNFVGFYLQRHGYRVLPVNPREDEILGETSYASLADLPVPPDVVDVFRPPARSRPTSSTSSARPTPCPASRARRSRPAPARCGCSSG